MSRLNLALGLPKDKHFPLGLLLASLEGLAAVALLGCSAWLISAAAEQPPILYLNMAIVSVRGFALGRAFFRYTQRLSLHDSTFQIQSALRPKIFRAIAPLAPAGLKGLSRGSITSQVVNDVEEIQNLGVRVIAPIVQALVVAVASVAALQLIAPTTKAWLSLLATLVLSALIALPASAVWNRIQVKSATDAKELLYSNGLEYLENLELLQAYEWDSETLATFSGLEKRQASAQKRFAITSGLGAGVFSLFSTLAVCELALQGGHAVQNGTVDPRMLALLALIPMAVFEIFAQMQPAIFSLQKYGPSARRVSEILQHETPPALQPYSGDAQLDSLQSLVLQAATFEYPDGSFTVGPVNLHINAGSVVAITGKSGSGKTTIAYGLAGFLRPKNGKVLLNGTSMADYSEAELRGYVGYLEQAPTIFNTSLRANLVIGRSNATDEELWATLEQVGLGATFQAREGLETHLGERGVAVSGGEAQRIALARALLADFRVLIFDEPTANVDEERADQLWSDFIAIARNSESRICIFISHDRDFAGMGIPVLAI